MVSVIIPSYNCGRFLEETIRSVLAQSYDNLELIIVDDGSTDNSLDIARSFLDKDSRVKVFTQTNSGRPSVPKNRGIRESKGDYICFLDADDTYHHERLETLIDIFTRYPELDIVFNDISNLYSDGIIDSVSILQRFNFLEISKDYIDKVDGDLYKCRTNFYNFMSAYYTGMCTPSIMIRRYCFDKETSWFPEDMIIGEDLDFWFRLAMTNRIRIAYIDRVLCYYRKHEDSITANQVNFLIGYLQTHTRNLERGSKLFTNKELVNYKKQISIKHFTYGYLLFLNYEMKSARSEFVKSIALTWDFMVAKNYIKTLVPASFIRKYRMIRNRG